MNMMSKFQRNAVLTGCIDSYCLVCETYLKNEDDALAHIEKPVHKKKLNATQYTDKYKQDRIWKVKNGYFCQFCNILMPTATKVGLHVMEIKHKDNRATQIKRVVNTIIVFEDICINEKAWNGIIDDTCVLCGAEFTDEQLHLCEPQHVLNLVLSKPEFGTDKNIYRKIDEDSFQCLTCNIVFPLSSDMSHLDSLGHKNQYEKCRAVNGETKISDCKKQENVEESIKAPKEPSTGANESKISYPKENSKLKELNEEPIQKESRKRIKTKAIEADCNILGIKDYISTDDDGNSWCILCDWTMRVESVYSHMRGKHHQTILKMHLDHKAKKSADDIHVIPDVQHVDVETNVKKSDDRSKILDSVSKFQTNEINVDFVSDTVTCKKCTKNIDFDCVSIEKHIEDHKIKNKKDSKSHSNSNTEKKTPVTKSAKPKRNEEESPVLRRSRLRSNSVEDLELFLKQNHLTTYGNKNLCNICEMQVPQSLKQMKEHVSSAAHKNKLSKKFKVQTIKFTAKQPIEKFIAKIWVISDMFIKEIVINEKYCVNILSFFAIVKTDGKLRCEVCQVHLSLDQIDAHKSLSSHENAFNKVFVITSLESEFLRELRPGVFHCGFCNLVKTGWENMEEHLNTAQHEEGKMSANWRLRQHLMAMQFQNQRENCDMNLLMRMI